MGVAGSGKTTIGRLLAESEGWPFFDADDFHSPEAKDKMRRGIGLTDADREPWLAALRARIDELRTSSRSGVFACSALKETYRRRLRSGLDVRFVYLKGTFELFQHRLVTREGHYAGPSLLRSQFDALEEPAGVPAVDASLTPEEMLLATRRALGLVEPREVGVGVAADQEAIRALFGTWREASKRRDVDSLLGLVTDDVVFLAPGQPPIRGKGAVRELFSVVLSRFELEQDFVIQEIQVLGEWAFCWGTDSSVMRPLNGGAPVRARGMGLSLLRRSAQGAWRFARGINNMTREVGEVTDGG